MNPVKTPQAPAAIGPYSQAIEAGVWLFCSGQIAIDPATGNFEGGDVVYTMCHRKGFSHGVNAYVGARYMFD